jgi:DNA invertase Pin-like site-specific DNA recombinase
MTLLGYMRVSRSDGSQVLDLQRDALRAAGVAPEHLYEDLASGKRDDRPGLAACLKALRAGDTLLVWKLDRLGRNLHHLVTTVHELAARGVGLRVLTGQGAQIDTTTAAGKLIFGIFAALAEFERELIVERTRAGIAAARARGRNGGRPYRVGRPNRAESYGKEPDFQPNFSLSLRTSIDWLSEAEFCGNNAGNHGGHVGFPVLWSGRRPSFPQ